MHPLSPRSHPLPILTLAEQVVAGELAYYRQFDPYTVTEADQMGWNRRQILFRMVPPTSLSCSNYEFVRYVLERHQQFLPSYLARHLSVEAWVYWFLQGGLVAPFSTGYAFK